MLLMVEAFMASLKVAETTVLTIMLIELFGGETDNIVGRVTSAVPVVWANKSAEDVNPNDNKNSCLRHPRKVDFGSMTFLI